MTKTEYLQSLKFNSFERYPPQFVNIYLKCEGVGGYPKRPYCKFIRANQFNAVTFDLKQIEQILNVKPIKWSYSWLPADEIDKKLYANRIVD